MVDTRAAQDGLAKHRPSAEAVALDESGHATRRFCSWHHTGWRSVLLRGLDNHAVVDDVVLPATDDQLLVLAIGGRATVEVADGSRWRRCDYVPGQIGMTGPGRSTRIRWRTTSTEMHRTLHLYLPGRAVEDATERLWGRDVDALNLPEVLATQDPVVEAMLRAMADAASAGTDDLYAESALAFLTVHLLTRLVAAPAPRELRPDDPRVRSAIDFMHDNLALPLSLADIAATVDLSSFHFLRMFKAGTGEPPRQFLNRLRIEAARRHLER